MSKAEKYPLLSKSRKKRTRHEYTEKSNFRSEEMALFDIYFKTESAYDCVAQLGELGAVQFIDVSA
jgi:hypothetical protein